MATLDAYDLARVDYIAGFRDQALSTIVAIQLAESGGNTDAHNTTGEDSRGISQINVAPGAHAGQFDPASLFNPIYNALAAFTVSGGGRDFSAWTTYTGGQYAGNMQSGQAAAIQATSEADNSGVTTVDWPSIGAPWKRLKDLFDPHNLPAPLGGGGAGVGGGTGGGIVGGAVDNLTGGLSNVGNFFGLITDTKFWAKVWLTAAGVLLVGLGVLLFSREARGDVEGAAKIGSMAAA